MSVFNRRLLHRMDFGSSHLGSVFWCGDATLKSIFSKIGVPHIVRSDNDCVM